MLVRMWRKMNVYTLLIAMYVSTTIVKNSMTILQKTKNTTTNDPAVPYWGCIQRKGN
jgi:hypothetical protein